MADFTEADYISMLQVLDPDDRDTWIRVGMALHAAGVSLPVWEGWSKGSSKYKSGECAMKWAGFKNDGSGIGPGTLVKMAKDAGWKAPRKNNDPEAWIDYVQNKTHARIVDHYDYVDLDGKYSHTKIRLRKMGGEKDFIQGWLRDGRWTFPSDNRKLATKGTIFCASVSGIKKAIEKGETVFIPEGEKDCIALTKKGFIALTSGAAKTWSDEISPLLDGADVVILADNDGPGKRSALKIKKSLEGHAKSTKVIIPSDQEKGDITDYFEAGGTIEELQQMIDGPEAELLEDKPEEDRKTAAVLDDGGNELKELDGDGLTLEFEKPGKPKQTIENIVSVLEHDPNLKGVLKYNALSHVPYLIGRVPWEAEEVDREFSNFDYSNLRAYLESGYKLSNIQKIDDALRCVESHNQFNPVIDRLSEIYAGWNHQSGYIENLLPDYLGVEKTEYSTEVMKLTMLGAISRVYNPGCKFDYMTVLIGQQGCGKSSFCRCLALNPEWYNDNFNTIEGDKAAEKLRGFWILEMAELLATKRAKDVEAIKSFLTSQADSYRPPYERVTEHRKRQCIFVGTTNNEKFLTDMSGNRRFLPVVCRPDYIRKDLFGNQEEVQKDFVNAWGEALGIFWEAGGKPDLILPKDAAAVALQMQEDSTEEDPRIGMIQDWLDNTDKDLVCACMICREVLGDIGTPPRRDSVDVSNILQNKTHGWKRVPGKVRCGEYGSQNCYRRSVDDTVDDTVDEALTTPLTTVDDPQKTVNGFGFRPVVESDKVPFD